MGVSPASAIGSGSDNYVRTNPPSYPAPNTSANTYASLPGGYTGGAAGLPTTPTNVSGQYGSIENPTYTNPPGPAGTFGYMTLAGVGEQQQTQAEQANAYALALSNLTGPELQGYTQYLNEMTSADPTQRVAAEAPGIQAQGQQTQQAIQNIQNMPRGGAQSYLEGEAYIQEATNIGDLIDQAYNSAQQAKGQLGEAGVQQTLAGMGLSDSALSAAAGTTATAVGDKLGVQNQHQQAIMGGIGSIAQLIANL